MILAALTLQPLPTVSAEQSCFRSDNTRSCLVISIHSNTRLLRQCECTSSTAQTPGDSARRSQKQVMHFMLSSLKRFFFLLYTVQSKQLNTTILAFPHFSWHLMPILPLFRYDPIPYSPTISQSLSRPFPNGFHLYDLKSKL